MSHWSNDHVIKNSHPIQICQLMHERLIIEIWYWFLLRVWPVSHSFNHFQFQSTQSQCEWDIVKWHCPWLIIRSLNLVIVSACQPLTQSALQWREHLSLWRESLNSTNQWVTQWKWIDNLIASWSCMMMISHRHNSIAFSVDNIYLGGPFSRQLTVIR